MKFYKHRYLEPFLRKDLKHKILIITGPRQCGKTMLSKNLYANTNQHCYFNYFDPKDRLILDKQEWSSNCKYLVFDEFHIKKNWKRWLKVLYEKRGLKPGVIVTGSAKLDVYKRSGDSLAGCFFSFRLHPLDLKEIYQINPKVDLNKALNRLLEVGGFPEPYFNKSFAFYNRWEKTHADAILKEDMLELDKCHKIAQLKTLLTLLKATVGKTIRYENFAKTLQCDGKTIKKMLHLLESFYFVFSVPPYYKNITKSIRKQCKYYFYDTAQVPDKGARFENLVACSLLKHNHFREDCYGENRKLFFLRNKDKKEIDFLMTKNDIPKQIIEAKWKDDKLSSSFDCFAKDLPLATKKIQLVKCLEKEKTTSAGHQILYASKWLAKL